ncbi:hypothetical protein B0I35DRAFT_428527 [Stachybotrys elegans]|uniref:Uncharacterized protein n=1 Tax=Stachybotrys elegans TaxID=80388 RepID=A0A8K0SUB1_9HYPO|nr:hypothetical protein B0I35DRAFT_428527 [Stachybotrys elegans]
MTHHLLPGEPAVGSSGGSLILFSFLGRYFFFLPSSPAVYPVYRQFIPSSLVASWYPLSASRLPWLWILFYSFSFFFLLPYSPAFFRSGM